MEKIVYDKNFEQFFKDNGYRTIDDFFASSADPAITENSKRFSEKVTISHQGDTKSFFFKRFYHSHLNDIIESLANFGKIISQGQSEWLNANMLIDKGFNAYKPVCFGHQKFLGIEKRSYFVSELLTGTSLPRFVLEYWQDMPTKEKLNLMAALGSEIHRLHDAGISLPDLYLWHIFIDKDTSKNYRFTFIDLHRMKHNVTSRTEKAKNLARLQWSLNEKYFDDALRNALMDSYAVSIPEHEKGKLIIKTRIFLRKLSARRKLKSYETIR